MSEGGTWNLDGYFVGLLDGVKGNFRMKQRFGEDPKLEMVSVNDPLGPKIEVDGPAFPDRPLTDFAPGGESLPSEGPGREP